MWVQMLIVSRSQLHQIEAQSGKPAIVSCPATPSAGGILEEISGFITGLKERFRTTDCRGEPLRQQQKNMSCTQASVSMLIESLTGERVSEEDLRIESSARGVAGYDKKNGTRYSDNAAALSKYGLKTNGPVFSTTIADVEAALSHKKPILIALRNPGHMVVCDGVKTYSDGTKSLLIRDPGMSTDEGCRELKDSELQARFFDPSAAMFPIE